MFLKIQIPLNEVHIGLDLSSKLGLRHLSNASLLIQNGEIEGAAILAIFGLEELGRILILKERYQRAINQGSNYIEIKSRKQKGRTDAFYDHKKKQKKAKSVLPDNSLLLHQGDFGEGFGKDFDASIFLDQELREAYSYLDYCISWQTPRPIDISRLNDLITKIESTIQTSAFL